MKRRDFISFLASAAVAAGPARIRAQLPSQLKRIGALMPYFEHDAEVRMDLTAFGEKLRQLGWAQGQNLQLDVRWAGGNVANLQSAARELVALSPSLLFARSTAATRALQRESSSIPIVFVIVSDPVGDGFVASLAKPAGNITGFTNVEASLGGKWLEIIKEIAPQTTRVAIVFGPNAAAGGGRYYDQLINAAAKSVGVKAVSMPVSNVSDIEKGLASFANEPNGALIVTPDATTTSYRQAIFAAAAVHRLPAVYPFGAFAREGGLISYGVDITQIFRQAAEYVDRILRGANPADLPVQGPTKFELVVNARAANTLGLSIPPTLLGSADEVIE